MFEDFVRDSTPGRDTRWTEEFCIQEATQALEKFQSNKEMVYYKQAIEEKDYSRDCFTKSCNKHPKSQHLIRILKKLSDLHESRLVERGLTKVYSDSMTKLVLKNAHGWEDKTVHDNRNTDIKLSQDELDEIDSVLEANEVDG